MSDNQGAPLKRREPREFREFRIRGVGFELQRMVKNAADYYGVDESAFLKPILRRIVDELPNHIREFKKLD